MGYLDKPDINDLYFAMYGDDTEDGSEYLEHYGMPRRSGRYPYGSGEDPYQHNRDFLSRVEELKNKGWEETAENIQKEFGLTTTQYRIEKAICSSERRNLQVNRVKSLAKDGLGPTAIGKIMGINESSVRSLLKEESAARMKAARNAADFIKDRVDNSKGGMIDVGSSVEIGLGITKEKLNEALYLLEREGYNVVSGGIPQPTNPGQQTTQRVICRPDIPVKLNNKGKKVTKYIYNYDDIETLEKYTYDDSGDTFRKKFTYPESLDSKRLMVRYKEDGGIDKDGLVEIRRGVDDLSLGNSKYSQVRIMVDGKKYIKGMAVYGDDKDFPPGVDVIFNTNKTKDKTKLEVLKDIKDDPENPFGSLIKDADQGGQYWYKDKKTGEEKLGLINKRADEGDWDDWSNALPSQFLSKQSKKMAEQQLNLAKSYKQEEFESICALTNPTVKKHLLEKFSSECDSAAVHLKAAALPGQKYHVIIPINTLKDNEVYAPGYPDGSKLALIRYPHGGTFEIPILTVNNKNKLGSKIITKDSIDAVGINHKIADQLSGADFDGDTVMCIPTHDKAGRVKIANREPLKDLKDFDPKMEYPERPGMKYMKDPKTGKDATQSEMGKISNLISDMTLGGAGEKELAAAVRHSMVVIDAGKHKLDYKKSEIDHNIAALRKKWQVGVDKNGNIKYGGASTIITKASGQATVDKRQGTPKINTKYNTNGTLNKDFDPNRPEGALIYKTADDLFYAVRTSDKASRTTTLTTKDNKKITYSWDDKDAAKRYEPVKKVDPETGKIRLYDSTGTIEYKTKKRTQKSSNMAETDDAMTLVSKAKHPMEIVYADYANSMKALGNKARKEIISTPNLKQNKEAKTKYAKEVASLNTKLKEASINAPKERQALRQANIKVQKAVELDPTMSKADVKKKSQQAVTASRAEVGSISRRERNIDITPKEWEAIQAGAISDSVLRKILNNTDVDKLREYATPRDSKSTLTPAKINTLKAMQSSNYTISQIADRLGVSTSTVNKYLKGKE